MTKTQQRTLSILIGLEETDHSIIDIDKTKDIWKTEPDKWFISQYWGEYTLYRATHKGRRASLKVRIASQVAVSLIDDLKLREMKSGIFRHSSTFKMYK